MSKATNLPTSKPKLPPMAAGQRYGRLLALEFIGRDKNRGVVWRFHCDCGDTIIALAANVRSGKTASCGCLRREMMAESALLRNTTHDMSRTAEYAAWVSMRKRCGNPSHKQYGSYGGRGIKVCERWRNSFEAFFADVGARPSSEYSIDRIDNDGGYEPNNVRWATRNEQARNRRTNHTVICQGQEMSLVEAAERSGLTYYTLSERLRKGWPIELALSVPARRAP